MRNNVVEDHQALERPPERHPLPEPHVSLLDGVVQGRVLQVIDTRLVVAAAIRCRELPCGQLLEEVDQLLPADDSGKSAVLAAQKETGMQHHFDQEGGLPVSEAECCDPRDALLVSHRNSSKMRGLGLRPDRPPRPPRPVLMRYALKPVRPFAAA